MARRDRPDRIRLVVVFGGQSAEHEVSCVTARHVIDAADHDRYDIVPIGIRPDGRWVTAKAAEDALRAGSAAPALPLLAEGPEIEPQGAVAAFEDGEPVVVFPLLHGPFGEDGTVQGVLELADVPYVGSGVLASAVAMDKIMAKQVVAYHGIPQASFVPVNRNEAVDRDDIVSRLGGYPVFVKPANMGSSIGVSKVHDERELDPALELAFGYDEWALVEEAVVAREIEVAVLGGLEPRASVPGEIRAGSEFYDFEDKYVDGRAELLIPAPLPPTAAEDVRALALQAFGALRCEGMARVDFFYEEGGRGFLLNEVNTIPGFTPASMYPKLWEMTGIPYRTLIDELVDLALDRHERLAPQRLAGRQPSLHREQAAPSLLEVDPGTHG